MIEPPLSAEEARAVRIEQLERRTARRVTGRPASAGADLPAERRSTSLAQQWPAVAYYFSSARAAHPGQRGRLPLRRAPLQHLRPGARGATSHRLLRGGTRDNASWWCLSRTRRWSSAVRCSPPRTGCPGSLRRRPIRGPSGCRGRLLREDAVDAYQDAFPQMRKLPGIRPMRRAAMGGGRGRAPGEDRGALDHRLAPPRLRRAEPRAGDAGSAGADPEELPPEGSAD